MVFSSSQLMFFSYITSIVVGMLASNYNLRQSNDERNACSII